MILFPGSDATQGSFPLSGKLRGRQGVLAKQLNQSNTFGAWNNIALFAPGIAYFNQAFNGSSPGSWGTKARLFHSFPGILIVYQFTGGLHHA